MALRLSQDAFFDELDIVGDHEYVGFLVLGYFEVKGLLDQEVDDHLLQIVLPDQGDDLFPDQRVAFDPFSPQLLIELL